MTTMPDLRDALTDSIHRTLAQTVHDADSLWDYATAVVDALTTDTFCKEQARALLCPRGDRGPA